MRNFKKMIQDVNDLVSTDFCFDMDLRLMPNKDGSNSEYTQEEARQMANIIGNVFMISHGITCGCGGKYELKTKGLIPEKGNNES